MRIFPKLFFWSLLLVFLFGALALAVGGELIKPTRTLESSEEKHGKLSVFSEPPELDVFLNQSKIGKTPIISMEVTPGIHTLKIGSSEREIYIIPDKSLQLSLFKGNFIEIKEQEKEKIQKQEEDTTKKNLDEPVQEKKGYQPKYDPAYWPLKPSGPIK
jgi:hypothetical protein